MLTSWIGKRDDPTRRILYRSPASDPKGFVVRVIEKMERDRIEVHRPNERRAEASGVCQAFRRELLRPLIGRGQTKAPNRSVTDQPLAELVQTRNRMAIDQARRFLPELAGPS